MSNRKQLSPRSQRILLAVKIAKRLWQQACEHDGIPADAKFVEFSPTNPYAEVAGRASITLNRLRAELNHALPY